MENLLWFFIEKPFEDVVPWFAAPFYDWGSKRIEFVDDPGFLPEFETDDQYFKRLGRSRQTIESYPLRLRLLEVTREDPFCMIETNWELTSEPWSMVVARGCGSPLNRFRVAARSGTVELVEFNVTDWWHRSRGVSAYRSEAAPSRWEFRQGGEPEPWEDLSRYAAQNVRDRLTPELLVEYAFKAFGVDINRLITRNFSRVANIVDAPKGEPLEQYKWHFEDIRERRIHPG